MENKKKQKVKIDLNEYFISFLSLGIGLYFFYGFFTNENSAGAGGYEGDLKLIWENLLLLKSKTFSNLDNPLYNDSRPPLSYIVHIYLNPFIRSLEGFRISTFYISFLVPILFFYSIKSNYKNLNSNIIILLALIVTLSPYFRTTAYWSLGENYGFIFLLISYIILQNFKKNYLINKIAKNYILIFFLCLCSSLCVYFDQKLVFIPLLVLIIILNFKISNKLKLTTCFFFFLFSLPYLYLISLWGSLLPTAAAKSRHVGTKINLYNLGYCLTIIAFYISPFLLFRDLNIKKIKQKIYVLILILFGNFSILPREGKGIIDKISYLFFDSEIIKLTFTIFSFLIALIVIWIFFDKKNDYFLVIYFLLLSLFIFPFFQEYLDPLIYILIFTFFKTKLNFNYKKIYLLVAYFIIFSLSSKLYYSLTL